AELLRLRRCDRDHAVLERVGRVGRVELEPELPHAELLGEPRRSNQRREARCEALLLRRLDGKEIGVAPDRQRAGRDRLAGQRACELLTVVDRIEWPPAVRADTHRLQGVVGLAVAATKYGSGQR